MRDSACSPPWTNVYGVARTTLACGTLLTLLANDAEALFKPAGSTLASLLTPVPLSKLSLFFLVPEQHLEVARWFAIVCLLVVASGWRPRLTGVLHWWISCSFAVSCAVVEGGDQVIAVMTALLIPVTLTDPRRWHWSTLPDGEASLGRKLAALVAASSFLMIRLQVAGIYFHAAVGKMEAREWVNGTAVYYWLTNPVFGLGDWLQPLVLPWLSSALVVTAATWGAMLLEVFLFMGLVMEKRWRPALLCAGLAFHFSILVMHGLVSFFFAMAGALVLYLRPRDQPFHVPVSMLRSIAWKARLRWVPAVLR